MWNHVPNSEFSQSNIGYHSVNFYLIFILRTTKTQVEASKDTLEHDDENQKATSHFVSEGLQPFEPILLELNENCNELAKETRRSDEAHTCHFTIRTERTRSRWLQTPQRPEQGPAWLKIGIRIHPQHVHSMLSNSTQTSPDQKEKQQFILQIT